MKKILNINWLQIDLLRQWNFPVLKGFKYDYITDKEITNALCDSRINFIDPNILIDKYGNHF